MSAVAEHAQNLGHQILFDMVLAPQFNNVN